MLLTNCIGTGVAGLVQDLNDGRTALYRELLNGLLVGRHRDIGAGDRLLQLFVLRSAKVACQAQFDDFACIAKYLDGLMIRISVERPAIDFDDLIVYANLMRQVSNTTLSDALYKNSRYFLCKKCFRDALNFDSV